MKVNIFKMNLSFFISSLCLVCFCQASAGQYRLFRGDPSNRVKHPFFVLVELKPQVDNKLNCGGVLVHDRFVISAAHCVDWVTETIRLKFGVQKPLKMNEETRKVVTVSAKDIVLHPQWSRSNKVHDIAIIVMKEPIKHNQYIQPIKFSNDCELEEFTDASVFGWGIVNSRFEFAEQIQWAPMTIVPSKKCKAKYPYYDVHSRSPVFCADGRNGQSVCKVRNFEFL